MTVEKHIAAKGHSDKLTHSDSISLLAKSENVLADTRLIKKPHHKNEEITLT